MERRRAAAHARLRGDDAEEFARARRLIRADRASAGRGGARTGCGPTGAGTALDVRALVRASLATGGDPVARAFRSRARRRASSC